VGILKNGLQQCEKHIAKTKNDDPVLRIPTHQFLQVFGGLYANTRKKLNQVFTQRINGKQNKCTRDF